MSQYELVAVGRAFTRGPAVINAVQGVDLTIEPGELVALEGPSGSGKTSGKVFFEGRDLAVLRDDALADLRLRSFGFVFQHFNLIPTLTALENVEVKLAPTPQLPLSPPFRARARTSELLSRRSRTS